MGESRFPEVVDCRAVYAPGCHCAFTDLTVWRGRVWLAFREAVNHSIHPSSQIVVMASADWGRGFREQARVTAPGFDIRDPHFFVLGERLHLVCPSWRLGDPPARNAILCRSADGLHWELFTDVSAFAGRAAWRPRRGVNADASVAYAAAYSSRRGHRDTRCVHLLKTADGVAWEEVSLIHGPADEPNETELCFLPGGELLALVRREVEPYHPLLARAAPPYTQWRKVGCDQFLQGPLLERLSDGRLLVVGRSRRDVSTAKGAPSVTRMFLLDAETGHLEAGAALESGGDTSYAGFVRLPEDVAADDPAGANALLSYYSGHAYANGTYRGENAPQRCAIYLAHLRV